MTTRFLFMAALASMLILLGTVFFVARSIRKNSIKEETELDTELPEFASTRSKEPRKRTPLDEIFPIPQIVRKPDVVQPRPALRRANTAPAELRPAALEKRSGRPNSAAVLLGLMAGATVMMLAHSQMRSRDARETQRGGKAAR